MIAVTSLVLYFYSILSLYFLFDFWKSKSRTMDYYWNASNFTNQVKWWCYKNNNSSNNYHMISNEQNRTNAISTSRHNRFFFLLTIDSGSFIFPSRITILTHIRLHVWENFEMLVSLLVFQLLSQFQHLHSSTILWF